MVKGGHQYYVPSRSIGPDGVSVDYVERTVSLTHGLDLLGGAARGDHRGTALIFRRRDVN